MAYADSDPAATTALVWLNALLYQELLHTDFSTSQLPPPHRGKRIPRPAWRGSPSKLDRNWREILEINWWPIFHFPRQALQAVPRPLAKRALAGLAAAAGELAGQDAVRRHDVIGRVFHRLLGTRKFLATNYTTVPAAVLLAGLAFDPEHAWCEGRDWSRPSTFRNLRVVDPACGTGTLLMAALQQILEFRRRHATTSSGHGETVRDLLENALHGYDVIPAALHLTATTLSMAHVRQLITNVPLFCMPHDVRDGRVRMGSLDFPLGVQARGSAQHLVLFPEEERDPSQMTGTGERVFDAYMPRTCDVMIANPPYTRAGGSGIPKGAGWNPVFGSALSQADQRRMTEALRRTLRGSPASLCGGLGSAFLLLARETIRPGGRLAFVLPATALTGGRWAPVREMLLEEFDIDWVVLAMTRELVTPAGTG